METSIAAFVKERRRMFNLTQVDLAEKSGVGLRFVRELEQGKQTLRIDKINQVLALFGHEVGAVQINKGWDGEVVRYEKCKDLHVRPLRRSADGGRERPQTAVQTTYSEKDADAKMMVRSIEFIPFRV